MQLLSLVLSFVLSRRNPVKADLPETYKHKAQTPALLDRANLPVGDCSNMTDGGPACCPLSRSHTAQAAGHGLLISSVVINAFCDGLSWVVNFIPVTTAEAEAFSGSGSSVGFKQCYCYWISQICPES